MVKYEEAIKKPFTDIMKLVVGIILSFVPIINWIAKGFAIECSGLGKNKPSKDMPKWGSVTDLFVKGLLSDIIFFIYALPAVIVLLFGVGLTIGSLMNVYMGSVISPELMTSVMKNQTPSNVIGSLISKNWVMAVPVLISMAPIFLVGAILMLFAMYATPIAVLNYIKNKKFSEAFNFGVISKKIFTGKYFVVWLVSTILTAILTVVLSIIPFIGTVTALFISAVIYYTLYGQVYREI